jgi:hypothetical protein
MSSALYITILLNNNDEQSTKLRTYQINWRKTKDCEKRTEKNGIAERSETSEGSEEEGWKGGTLNILHSMPPSLSGFCATHGKKKERKKERKRGEKEKKRKKAVARANVYNKHRGRKKVV